MKKIIGSPEQTNTNLVEIIKKTKINYFYIKNQKDFRDQILDDISPEDNILDIGMGMRQKHKKIKANLLETLDVNDFGEYPNIICDICADISGLENKYDKILCLAILEHVYDPFKAVNNLKKMLKNNGTIYGYVPYLFYYHAPENLKFQDYFRFSKDSLSFLFKDYSSLEIYPVRGRISTPLNILFAGRWKKYIEKTKINILLDKLSTDEKNLKQCSGFNFIVQK